MPKDIGTALAVVEAVCAAVIALLSWGYLTGSWKKGSEDGAALAMAAVEALRAEVADRAKDINRRFDDAGRETSKWGTYCQGLEAHYRTIFADEKLTAHQFTESKEERERLWRAIEDIKRAAVISDRRRREP